MKNLCDMAARKEERLESVRAILDKAEAEGRSLTAEENARYSAGMKEVRKLTEELETERELQEREMRGAVPIEDYYSRAAPGEFRSFGKEDLPELRARFGTIDPSGPQNFSRWLAGIVTGKGEKRQETISGEGTYLIPDPLYGSLIVEALSKTACVEAGARVLDMTSNTLRLPRITALPQTEWLAELARATRSDLPIAGVTAEASKVSCQMAFSIELFEDSQLLQDSIGDLMSQALARAFDQAALVGVAGGPTGITNTVGIHEITDVGLLDGYWPFVQANGLIQSSCYTTTALVAHPNVMAQIDGLTNTLGDVMTPPYSWQTYRKLPTCLVRETGGYEEAEDHVAIMGDFKRLYFMTRTPARLEISRCAGDAWTDYMVQVRMYARVAAEVVSPAAFCAIGGIEAADLTAAPEEGS